MAKQCAIFTLASAIFCVNTETLLDLTEKILFSCYNFGCPKLMLILLGFCFSIKHSDPVL